MSFGFYPFAKQLQDRVGVPVIDPLRAGVAAASAMLALGVLPSARAFPRIGDPQPLVRFLSSLAAPAPGGAVAVAGGRTGA
jgi:hypothetical protein